MSSYPIVGIPCDVVQSGLHPFHAVGEKYINAVANGANGCPLLIPACGVGQDLEPIDHILHSESLLNSIDGLFLPGSPSNVDPGIYSDGVSVNAKAHDPQRDATTIPLIKAAIKKGIPILAVCRGMQELNVAMGGTLHQQVHALADKNDHRENKNLDRAGQYAPTHRVDLVPGGLLEKLAGIQSEKVNSLHGQGVKDLGEGLTVEAYAPDGLVEAFRLDNDLESSDQFLLAVQWHPEWRFRESILSSALFKAFGDAIRSRG